MYILLNISYALSYFEAGQIFTFLAFIHIGNTNFMSKVKIRLGMPFPLYYRTPYFKVGVRLVMP